MVASIGNRFEKIGTWPGQNCTAHRLALGDRLGKEAYKDEACKGLRRADAAKETSTKVRATKGVGIGIAQGLQGRHGKVFGETAQEEGFCFFQAQGGEVLTRGNADDTVKYTTEVIRAEKGDIRHVFERERLTQLFSHDTNDAFNG